MNSTTITCNQSFAFTLFPAITVSSGRCAFELTIVTLVTYAGALSATAKGSRKATCSTFEDVLINVFSSSPSETARVVTAENMKR